MSKKEIKLIVAILFVALGIYVGVQVYNRLNVKTYGIVTYKNQVIHTFNVNKDEDYYFNGSYGRSMSVSYLFLDRLGQCQGLFPDCLYPE